MMENKFKVVMKKNEEVLRDFILFRERANHASDKFKMIVLGIGLIVIGILAAKGGNAIAGSIIGIIGIVMVAFALFIHNIAVIRLKKADIAYKNQTELTYIFLNSGIYVYENEELTQCIKGYARVSCLYEDEKNFYVGIDNEDLFLLPKKAFTEGDTASFISFMETKSHEKSEFLPTTVKKRWILQRAKQKQAAEAYDARAAELRKQEKAKKEKNKKH